MDEPAGMSDEFVREIKLADIDPRVRAFGCGGIVDVFAVETAGPTVLIDSMVSPESIGRVVEILGVRLGRLIVVNTHGDWDHVWGNCFFSGPKAPFPAPILSHELAAERMTSPEAVTYLHRSQAENPDLYRNVRIEPANIGVTGKTSIYGGDLTLRLLETPGHSPDHMAIWIPELRLLVAGDAAEMPLPLVPDAQSVPALRESLYKMSALDPRHVLYCHARGYTSAGVINHNIAYFDEAEGRCRRFLRLNSGYQAANVSPDALAWPLEDALPDGVAPTDLIPDADFYRRAHEEAVRAMAGWVQAAV